MRQYEDANTIYVCRRLGARDALWNQDCRNASRVPVYVGKSMLLLLRSTSKMLENECSLRYAKIMV